MIKYTKGNLLEAKTEALVNTVNEVGVMGKGIALMFKEAFPQSSHDYEQGCKAKLVQVGRMFVTHHEDLLSHRWIIHFPTKKHWRNPSKLEWIRNGLRDLVRVIHENNIQSIALPPLGCGNGGLEWAQVRQEIELAFEGFEGVEVLVYEPTSAYQNAAKRGGVEELTPARALIAELVRRYSVLGLDCTNLEIQKLAWFLQRAIHKSGNSNPLDLHYTANKFGPYADNLRHLLNGLDGSYLHCEKRLSDAGPLDVVWFEELRRKQVEAYIATDDFKPFIKPLENTAELIDGFESPLGMELLATVDWIVFKMNKEASLAGIKEGLRSWPGGQTASKRKIRLFDERLINLALERLEKTSNLLPNK